MAGASLFLSTLNARMVKAVDVARDKLKIAALRLKIATRTLKAITLAIARKERISRATPIKVRSSSNIRIQRPALTTILLFKGVSIWISLSRLVYYGSIR